MSSTARFDRLLEILPQHNFRLTRLEDSRKRWADAGKVVLGVCVTLATAALGLWLGLSG